MSKSNYREKLLLDSLPDGSGEKAELAGKIRKYRSECGCSMGGKFLVVAAAAVVFYFTVLSSSGLASLPWKGFTSLLFIFFSAATGKLTGKGLARLRLMILLKSAYKKLPDH